MSIARTVALAAGLGLSWTVAALSAEIDIQVTGASDELEDALRVASLLRQAETDNLTEDPAEVLAAARADYARLLGVLYDYAHYGAVISIQIDGREAAEIPPLAAPDRIDRVVARIAAGPIYTFSETRITPLAPDSDIPAEFSVGEPAEVPVIRDAASAAVLGWKQQGNAKADIAEEDIVARHAEDRVAVRIEVAPGPRVTFGDMIVEGNEDVRASRIRGIAGLKRGEVYSPDEVDAAARRLRETGAFRSVVVEESDTVNPDGTLDYTIRVVEQTPRRFGLGAEYSNVEGVRLSGYWMHRNLTGGADRLRIEGEIAGLGGETGGVDYRIGGRYERPATPRRDTDLYVLGEIEHLDEPGFVSDTAQLGFGFSRRLTDRIEAQLGIGYVFSDVTDDFGQETYEYVILPFTAEFDYRDNALNPKAGWYLDTNVTPFYGVAGTGNGAHIEADARGYYSVASERLTLAGRMQLGSLVGPDLLDTPPIFRFYSGGGGTVRGQDYQSLGVEIDGDKTGGRSFVGLSAEARANIGESFQAVAFYDWGYVGSETFYDGSGDSHSGAGLGLRYNTGIGPIRLDVATPVSGDTEAGNYYIYVGIGQAF